MSPDDDLRAAKPGRIEALLRGFGLGARGVGTGEHLTPAVCNRSSAIASFRARPLPGRRSPHVNRCETRRPRSRTARQTRRGGRRCGGRCGRCRLGRTRWSRAGRRSDSAGLRSGGRSRLGGRWRRRLLGSEPLRLERRASVSPLAWRALLQVTKCLHAWRTRRPLRARRPGWRPARTAAFSSASRPRARTWRQACRPCRTCRAGLTCRGGRAARPGWAGRGLPEEQLRPSSRGRRTLWCGAEAAASSNRRSKSVGPSTTLRAGAAGPSTTLRAGEAGTERPSARAADSTAP